MIDTEACDRGCKTRPKSLLKISSASRQKCGRASSAAWNLVAHRMAGHQTTRSPDAHAGVPDDTDDRAGNRLNDIARIRGRREPPEHANGPQNGHRNGSGDERAVR